MLLFLSPSSILYFERRRGYSSLATAASYCVNVYLHNYAVSISRCFAIAEGFLSKAAPDVYNP